MALAAVLGCVVTAVGGRDVIIKKIQIERVKEAQARELMRWEAEQHVPFDMESVELDFQILDPDEAVKFPEVVRAAREMGLDPSVLGIGGDRDGEAGFAGLVDGLVNRVRDELPEFGGDDVSVIATGDSAPLIIPESDTIDHLERDLVPLVRVGGELPGRLLAESVQR